MPGRATITMAAVMAAAAISAAPAAARGGGGGGGGGGGTPAAARCAALTVTNNGQTVRNFNMPDIRYNLASCGTDPLSVRVSVTEIDGFLSTLCPSPTAGPVTYSLPAKKTISATAPVFRGPCGYQGNPITTFVDSPGAWQGHNLKLTATDNATGATLSSAFFSWQDAQRRP